MGRESSHFVVSFLRAHDNLPTALKKVMNESSRQSSHFCMNESNDSE